MDYPVGSVNGAYLYEASGGSTSTTAGFSSVGGSTPGGDDGGPHLTRALFYLSAYALERRRDPLSQGIPALRRLFSDLRLYGALTEVQVHRHLALAVGT